MKATKSQLVDYIYNNFTRNGKKIPKKTLNESSVEVLERIIIKNDCQKKLEEWINKPKTIKFMVDGIKDGEELAWDCEYSSEDECRKDFENEGIKIIKIATKRNHHRCKYCYGIANGKETNLLCDECRRMFGHIYYDEL